MNPNTLTDNSGAIVAIVVILAAVVIGLVIWNVYRRRRTRTLKDQFGPEYQTAVESYGPRRAEQELEARQKRVKTFDIRPLTPEQQQRFSASWKDVQARFVDNPSLAVSEADSLVKEAMQARGYPMVDFEQRSADISVDHPHVVSHYRAARDIAMANRQGRSSTEDLRQALVHYRSLFDELLETAPPMRRVNVR